MDSYPRIGVRGRLRRNDKEGEWAQASCLCHWKKKGLNLHPHLQ